MKTLKYLAIAASALLLAVSCQETLEKSEVEAGFASKGAVPTATISLSDYKIVETEARAEVKGTFAGIAGQDSLEIGFIVSLDPTFTSSTSYMLDAASDGTYSQNVKVSVGKKNYVKAVAATVDGASFSETLVLDVPTVPWYNLVVPQYTTELWSYFDEGECSYPTHVLDFVYDFNAKTAVVNNIDAWAYKQGVPTSLTGVVDLDARTITMTTETGYFDAGISSYGFIIYALDPAGLAEGKLVPVTEMVFTFSEDGQTVTSPLYCTYSIQEGNSGSVDIYLPQTYSAVVK